MSGINKWVFWAPRIFLILFILFLAIFSLDIFEGNYGFWGTILGLFMHNLPSLILLIILIISWKHELVGGIIFMTLGTICFVGAIIFLVISPNLRFNPILIIGSIVFLLIGILFLIGWKQKKKIDKKSKQKRG